MPSTMGSNPLPEHAEHTEAPVASTPADSNPLPSSASSKPGPSASSDLLVPAVGYIFWILALIALMGQNTKSKFHGAQALLYGVAMGLLYLPVMIFSAILGAVGGILGIVPLLGYFIIIVGVPLYMAYKTYKGDDVVLPVIGRFAAEKIGYRV